MGSRVRIVCGLSAAVLTLAGCVSMPSSGPPSSLPVKQADAGQSQNYIGAYPQPPQPGWSAEQVVDGFLFASSSWYTANDVVRQYLTPREQQTWSPSTEVTVFGSFHVATLTSGSQQATVSVDGPVRAALNSSGQQLYTSSQDDTQPSSSSSASCPSSAPQCFYSFTLAKVDGQWRISLPPPALLLDEASFEQTWEPQDLYFFDTARHVLVPDSVFVPKGTGETDLFNRLANALKNGPPSWLANATANLFSGHVTSVSVSVVQPTAVVNLKGSLTAKDGALPDIAAELVWTLAAATASGPSITGVQLEVNGVPWNTPVNQGPAYDPYPSGTASFTFADKNGVPQSLCGSTKNSPVGVPVPIFGHPGGGEVTGCGASPVASLPSSASPTTSASTTAVRQPSSPKPSPPAKSGDKTPVSTVTMVAVSPDGKYIAEVSSNGNQLSLGPVAGHNALKPVSGLGPAITSISWDRQDDLWLTQDGTVLMVPQPQDGQFGKPSQANYGGNVAALSVAPDGVRIAMILQPGLGNQGSQIKLASINPNGVQPGQPTPHGNSVAVPTINGPLPLGPGITDATALTWYDADHLIVLTPSGGGNELQEISVDGRASTQSLEPPQTPPDVTVDSVAAANTNNVVVVGLSDGHLEVSAGFEGPWEPVPGSGYAPAYVIPPAPTGP